MLLPAEVVPAVARAPVPAPVRVPVRPSPVVHLAALVELASLAQQMVGALGQVGQLGQGLSQAVGQAAQLATGIVQASTQAAAQGQQGGAASAGKDCADDGTTGENEDDRDKAEKAEAEADKDRDSETDGAAGPSAEQPGLKAPIVDGLSETTAPAGPQPARPQTRPADGQEV